MQPIFEPKDSPLHRLHPLTKLLFVVLLILSAYLVPFAPLPLLLFGLVLVLAAVGQVGQSLLRPILVALLPFTVSIFLIQGILFPPANATPLPLGPLTLTVEGLQLAFVTSTRLLLFSAAIILLLRVTHPADLVFALTERGLPRSIGYILLVTLQIVPDMSARATAILEAQRSRGLETQRGFLKVRGIVPLVGPLVVGALADVEERAMALESRAYTAPGPKTSLRQLHDTPAQRAARALLLLTIVGLIAWRVTYSFM